MEQSRICKVGYALNAKKMRKSGSSIVSAAKQNCNKRRWQGGGLADILLGNDGGILDGVDFSPWESEIPISQQPHYDIVIHKLTDDIEKSSTGVSTPRIEALQAYLKSHPTTVLVDPIRSVQNVTNRMQTCSCLSNIERKYFNAANLSSLAGKYTQREVANIGAKVQACPISQPKYCIVESVSEDILTLMAVHGMVFPIICKPLVACGTPLSHCMVVVVRAVDIYLIQRPCVVQQYYDHDAVLYKVYVIGEDVMVYKRPSLPNLCSYSASPDWATNSHGHSTCSSTCCNSSSFPSSISSSSSSSSSSSRCSSGVDRSRGRGSCSSLCCADGRISSSSSSSSSSTGRYNIGADYLLSESNKGRDSNGHRLSRCIHSVAFDSRYAYPSLSDFLDPIPASTADGSAPVPQASTRIEQPTTGPLSPITHSQPPEPHWAHPSQQQQQQQQSLPHSRLHVLPLQVKSEPQINTSSASATDGIEAGEAGEAVLCAHVADTAGTSIEVGDATEHPSAVSRRERKPSSHDLSSDEEGEEDDEDGSKRYGVPLSRFQSAAGALAEEFGLSLFGFDVIIPADPTVPRCPLCGRGFKRHGPKGSAGPAGQKSPLKCKYCGILAPDNATDDSVVFCEEGVGVGLGVGLGIGKGGTGEVGAQKDAPSSGGYIGAVGSAGDAASSTDPEDSGNVGMSNLDPQYRRPLLVIDVNFFPSYKEVGDFPSRLRAFLRRKAGLATHQPTPPLSHLPLPPLLLSKDEPRNEIPQLQQRYQHEAAGIESPAED